MERQYQINYEKSMYNDLDKLKNYYLNKEYYKKIVERIFKDINTLRYMPRIHKTISYAKEPLR